MSSRPLYLWRVCSLSLIFLMYIVLMIMSFSTVRQASRILNVIRGAPTFKKMLTHLWILLMFWYTSGNMPACLPYINWSASITFYLIYHVGFINICTQNSIHAERSLCGRISMGWSAWYSDIIAHSQLLWKSQLRQNIS